MRARWGRREKAVKRDLGSTVADEADQELLEPPLAVGSALLLGLELLALDLMLEPLVIEPHPLVRHLLTPGGQQSVRNADETTHLTLQTKLLARLGRGKAKHRLEGRAQSALEDVLLGLRAARGGADGRGLRLGCVGLEDVRQVAGAGSGVEGAAGRAAGLRALGAGALGRGQRGRDAQALAGAGDRGLSERKFSVRAESGRRTRLTYSASAFW
jgi:hypothetical protein